MSSAGAIRDRLLRIRERIAESARRAGRAPESVRLIGVTKYVDATVARELFLAGCHDLGESRPQQLWERAESLRELGATWHLIGHLQRNKARRMLACDPWIHSVDSERLLLFLDSLAEELEVRPQVLLEVHISSDPTKQGFAADELPGVLAKCATLRRVRVLGLMGMASLSGGADGARREFARLRELRDSLRPSCPDNTRLDELSMGMSGDYEEAILEGATMVRIGSALFED